MDLYLCVFLMIKEASVARPLGILHVDPNLGVLIALQKPAYGKVRISLAVVFECMIMCLLLGHTS